MEDERPVKEFFKFLYEYFEVANKWVEIQRFSGEHPVASVFLLVTLAAFAVPVVAFLVFVISSVVLSFLGFFLFEGKSVYMYVFWYLLLVVLSYHFWDSSCLKVRVFTCMYSQ